MKKEWLMHVQYVQESILLIQDYCRQSTIEEDQRTYDAVLRRLQTLAEATQHIPIEIQEKYPHIEWRKISGLRNVLVHDYLGEIDPLAISGIVEKRLPELLLAVQDMLSH